ncbi:MAG: Fmu (Sun) domain protein [Verrucomicrobia bacterium]|nr:Fmu (Sun) domain protein [Verrucomicrobiota bacterium]
MSVATSQAQVYLRLVQQLRPIWRSDQALPAKIQRLLASERRFGSRDRRLYRELIYTTLRYLPWIEPWLEREPARAAKVAAWLAAATRDTRAYRAEICGDWPVADSLAARAKFLEADPAALLPAWFSDECPVVFTPAELSAQLARAPLWLRLQTDDEARVADEFDQKAWRVTPSPALPSAWKVLDEADVTQSVAYAKGLIEIQDLGSQFVLESIGVEPGGRWLDACAGAGGKTLQLARLVGSDGAVTAHDIRPEALDELLDRADRAGLENVQTVASPSGTYDGVLVDAPCSGSGTWRRSPHLKWTTTPAAVAERADLQRELLARFSAHVRPGGLLAYATCSLSRRENEDVVEAFLLRHPDFRREKLARTFGFTTASEAITILPARHDTDGFHVALLRRR